MTAKPLVGVLWDDVRGDSTKVIDEDNLEAFHSPLHVITYGLLLVDDDKGVTVATEDCGNGEWRGPTFVLRELIREVWIVSKKPTRRRLANKLPRKEGKGEGHVNSPSKPPESDPQLV